MAIIIGLNFTGAQAQVFVQEFGSLNVSENDLFADSLATNGTLFAVGAENDDTKGTDAGAVSVYNLATGVVVRQIFCPLSPGSGALSGRRFGRAVAASGNVLAVGAPSEGAGGGRAVYLFNFSTGALLRRIGTPNGGTLQFGGSLAIGGDLLVIGSPQDAGSALPSSVGAIYVFNLRSGVLTGPIFADAPEAFAEFGASVAVLGGLIAIGAPAEDSGGSNRGAAYLLDAQTTEQLHRFTASAGANGDNFGKKVALARQRLIVSAPFKNSGTGEVFAFDTASFEQAWPTPNVGSTTAERHGSSLAAVDDLVVVGAILFNATGAPDAGRVQVFQARDGNLLHTLTAPGPVAGDHLGHSVATSGATVLTLATSRDVLAADDNQGAVFRFSPVRSPLPFPEIALKNSAPPGAANTTFSSFNQLAVSPAGFTTFDANVVGTGAALGKNSGIWTDGNAGQQDILQNVRRTGLPLLDPPPSPPELQRKGLDFTNPVSNIGGLLGFTATTAGTGTTTANDKVFAVWDGAVLRFPLQESALLVTGLLNTFQPPRQTSQTSGTSDFANNFVAPITFRLGGTTFSGNDSGLVRFIASGELETLREGGSFAPVPPANSVRYGQFLPRAALGSIRITFTAFLQAFPPLVNNLAVFDYSHGDSPAVFARKGDEAPGYEDKPVGVFSNFLAETNTGRSTFIRAAIVPPAGSLTKNEGIWSNRISGDLHLALLKGDEKPPGLPGGVTIKSFLCFAGNRNGGILAWVQLQGTGVTAANDHAVILSRIADVAPHPVEILLREGSPAPGCDRARIGAIQALDAEDEGSYVVLVSLIVEAGGATVANNQALFLGNTLEDGPDPGGDDDEPVQRQPALMLRKGMQFIRNGSPIVKSIGLPGMTVDASGAMNTGLAHHVATVGALPVCSAVVTFNDGQTSVVSIFP
jgi:outer membrane protein assembly factor BamB